MDDEGEEDKDMREVDAEEGGLDEWERADVDALAENDTDRAGDEGDMDEKERVERYEVNRETRVERMEETARLLMAQTRVGGMAEADTTPRCRSRRR